MATRTATTMLNEPIVDHIGDTTVQVTWTDTLSAGDVLQLVKVPNRAKVLDAKFYRAANGGDISFSLNGTVLFTSTASGSAQLGGAYMGTVISVTDSDYPKYKIVQGTAASASISGTLKFSITYTMNHSDNT